MNPRVTFLTLAALAMTACSGVRIPRSYLEDWHAVDTASVRIVAEASAVEARALASDVASFDAAFAYLLGRQIDPPTPTTIVLIRDVDLGRRFRLGRGVAGWASVTLEAAFAFVHIRRSPVATRLTLFHEYTHLLLARNRRRPLPRWYNEGLASYFSTLTIRDGALVVGAVPSNQLGWLVGRGPVPLERLFGEPMTRKPEETFDFYATAWALIHHLMGSPRGRSELSSFAEAQALGVPIDQALQSAFGRPMEQLEEELSTHIGYLARGVPAEIVLDEDQLVIAMPREARALEAGATARQLGALVLAGAEASDDWLSASLARRLLEIAANADPRDARTRAALAAALALDGDLEGAEGAIEGSLRESPDDPRILVYAGRVGLAAEDHRGARESFERALRVDERSAVAWFGLGRSLDGLGHQDAALTAFERARGIGWSASLDLEIGRLYLASGRNAEALELLRPLASDPHGGSSTDRAKELLDEAGIDAPAGAGQAVPDPDPVDAQTRPPAIVVSRRPAVL